MLKECLICRKTFITYPSRIKFGLGKYCSQKCTSCAPYAGMKGKTHSKETKKRCSISKIGEKNPNWKGNDVGYFGLHARMYRKFGQPSFCSECGMTDKSKKYHWANISGEYLKDVSDFKRLCVKCHRIFDQSYLNFKK